MRAGGRDLRRADRVTRPRARSPASATPSTGRASPPASTTPARDHGIEGRILILAVRNFGVERAEIAEHAAGAPAPLRRRLLDGRRRGGLPARAFARGLRDRGGRRPRLHGARGRVGGRGLRARRARATRHAITHGVRAIEDPALVAELARRQITLEVCPTSNVVLGVFPTYEEHPFPVLRDAGIVRSRSIGSPATAPIRRRVAAK